MLLNANVLKCVCFVFFSLAVFAQYEDHLSIYDWCPDQTLWDWLPGVACLPLELFFFQRSTIGDSGFLPKRLSSWHIILFTGSSAHRPNLRHESRPNEAVTSVTLQCSALKALHAVLNKEGLYRFISRLFLLSWCVDILLLKCKHS